MSSLLDDVYVDVAEFYGDVNIDVIRPNGPSTSGWTPSPAVANWMNVDDITPDGDTSTVASTTVGDLDLYTMEAIPTGLVIKAIQGIASVKKDTAGLAALKLQYGSGGGALLSDEFYPSEGNYIMLRDGRKDITSVGLFGQIRTK